MLPTRTALVATLLLAAAPLAGQAGAPPRPALMAAPLAGQVRMDGRLDEAAWAAAEVATNFTQAYPNPGAAASQRTEARVLVGPDALYVAARMFDSAPDSIAAQMSRRDATGTYSDRVLLFIDSHNDRRTAFHFGVNPRGVKQDSYRFNDVSEDLSWDAVWEVATSVDSLGWTAEFRIPFSQLRFSQGAGERSWGLGIMRDVARNEERSTWSAWTRNSPGFVSTLGELGGLAGVRAPQRLEVMPYTSARLKRAPGDGANPFYQSNDVGASAGVDVRYGLPGGLTLTATVNPDFGQVEVDPAVVNLSAFETFYPERRPFFVEASDIFEFGEVVSRNSYSVPRYFYSRRIGRAPQRRVAGEKYEYVDAPPQSTILGAAKVTGKTGGWSLGFMDAVTGTERARVLLADGGRSHEAVEPLTNYLAGRVRRDLRRGATVLGGLMTATHRDMSEDAFAPLLRSSAYMGGLDAQHSWNRRQWTLSGFYARSQIYGDAAAINAAQRSSARYFQRPDARQSRLDPERGSLAGHVGAAAISRSGTWDASLVYQETSPGFEVNDLGFQSAADRRAFSTYLGRRINRPRGMFRSHSYFAYTTHAWNFDGDNVYASLNAGATGSFKSFWSAGLDVAYDPAVMSDRRTRGGPLSRTPAGWNVLGSLATDRRKKVFASGSLFVQNDEAGQWQRTARVALTMRPTTSLQASVGPRLERVRTASQFVLARADSLATSTFGRRYIFADVDQTTVALDARLNWTFSPTLSLEVFAQPYVSTGDFSNYKEFTTPRTFDFAVYGRDRGTIASTETGYTVDPDGAGPARSFGLGERDFTFRSLRGNAVLRWEYRPGSTLFFVWQQLRSGEDATAEWNVGRDVSGIFSEPAENVFVIKATYWLGR
jgi:hypothetical protein